VFTCCASIFFESLSVFVLLLTSAHAANPCTLVATIQRVSDGDTLTAINDNGTNRNPPPRH
jgi:hypothetical protein